MNLLAALGLMTLLDGAAVTILILGWLGIGWIIDHPPAARPSVSLLMAAVRRQWMVEYIKRDNRIFDAQIISSLRQGTSFFASTCLLAIGGALALIGNTAPLMGLAAEIGTAPTPALLWQIRLLPAVLFLTNAFLKFVWANRVFGYCSVMMAAVPAELDNPVTRERAMQAAELNIRAAVNFNAGLRGIYFALGSLGWLLGPLVLIASTLIVLWVLWSREFLSGARDVIITGNHPPKG